jgi:hypothetical protein
MKSMDVARASLLLWSIISLSMFVLADSTCQIEPGHHYPSRLNQTTLRVCNDTKAERVCIVGAGSSAVHMGWLLRRRGYVNTVLFEKMDRIGGKIFTHEPVVHGDVVRELSAAFLSPDYYEVRGLADRFGQVEVPFSVSKMIQMHSTNSAAVATPAEWYNTWISNITGNSNVTANGDAISSALGRYYKLHASIFGQYKTRLPPAPKTPAMLTAIDCTILEFLEQNDLEILHPLFYNFFVMQGMGLLKMTAYYGLTWVNPNSLSAGGFGNDMDTPLAMMKVRLREGECLTAGRNERGKALD